MHLPTSILDFVDSRLYVSVRPELEYRLVEVGERCVRYIVGDDAQPPELTKIAAPESVAHDDVVELRDLYAECMRVCSMTEEYLRGMEMEWVEFLSRLHRGFHAEMQAVHRDLRAVRRVRASYRDRDPTLVDAEYQRELAILRERVDETVARFRATEPPRVARSAEPATVALRAAFVALRSRRHARPARARAHFEQEMQRAQHGVSRSFDARVADLLRCRVYAHIFFFQNTQQPPPWYVLAILLVLLATATRRRRRRPTSFGRRSASSSSPRGPWSPRRSSSSRAFRAPRAPALPTTTRPPAKKQEEATAQLSRAGRRHLRRLRRASAATSATNASSVARQSSEALQVISSRS